MSSMNNNDLVITFTKQQYEALKGKPCSDEHWQAVKNAIEPFILEDLFEYEISQMWLPQDK